MSTWPNKPNPLPPPGQPMPPKSEPCSVTVPAEPPAVADDPVEAQHQARIWREDVIRMESVIAKLSAQLKA